MSKATRQGPVNKGGNPFEEWMAEKEQNKAALGLTQGGENFMDQYLKKKSGGGESTTGGTETGKYGEDFIKGLHAINQLAPTDETAPPEEYKFQDPTQQIVKPVKPSPTIRVNNRDVPLTDLPSPVWGNEDTYAKDLQDRIDNKTFNGDDIRAVSKATGYTPYTAEAFMGGDKDKGEVLKYYDKENKDKSYLKGLIDQSNTAFGFTENGSSLDTDEGSRAYLDKIKTAYAEKSRKEIDALPGDEDVNVPGQPSYVLNTGMGKDMNRVKEIERKNAAAAAQIDAMVTERIMRRTVNDPTLTKDQAVDKVYKFSDARGKEQVEKSIDDRLNPDNYTAPISRSQGQFTFGDLFDTESDRKKDIDELQTKKGLITSRVNDMIGEKISFNLAYGNTLVKDYNEKVKNGQINKDNIAAAQQTLKDEAGKIAFENQKLIKDYATQEEVDKQYPTVKKLRIVADLNDYDAIKSGNVKGYENFFGSGGYQDTSKADYLKMKGYDLNDPIVKQTLVEDREKNYHILGSPVGEFADVFINSGKSLLDLAGIRTTSDQLADKAKAEFFPTHVGENDEMQLTWQGKLGQAIGTTTGQVVGQGLLQKIMLGLGAGAGLNEARAASVAFWGSGSLTSFDQALQDSYDFINKPAERTAYALLIAGYNAAFEKLFPDVQLFQVPGVKNELIGAIKKFGSGKYSQDEIKGMLEAVGHKAVDFGKKFSKHSGEEVGEEVGTSIAEDGTRALFGDPNMSYQKAFQDVMETAVQTATGMIGIGAWGAHREMRAERNVDQRKVLYNTAIMFDKGTDIINNGYQMGKYDKEERDDKLKTINTARTALDVVKSMEEITKKPLSEDQKAVYVANLTAESLLKQQLGDFQKSVENTGGDMKDEVNSNIAKGITNRISNLQSQRSQIINDEVAIDEFGNVTSKIKEHEKDLSQKSEVGQRQEGGEGDQKDAAAQAGALPQQPVVAAPTTTAAAEEPAGAVVSPVKGEPERITQPIELSTEIGVLNGEAAAEPAQPEPKPAAPTTKPKPPRHATTNAPQGQQQEVNTEGGVNQHPRIEPGKQEPAAQPAAQPGADNSNKPPLSEQQAGEQKEEVKPPEVKAPAITPQTIHQAAKDASIPYDNDKAFMDVSEELTAAEGKPGKRHLDEMNEEELHKVLDYVKAVSSEENKPKVAKIESVGSEIKYNEEFGSYQFDVNFKSGTKGQTSYDTKEEAIAQRDRFRRALEAEKPASSKEEPKPKAAEEAPAPKEEAAPAEAPKPPAEIKTGDTVYDTKNNVQATVTKVTKPEKGPVLLDMVVVDKDGKQHKLINQPATARFTKIEAKPKPTAAATPAEPKPAEPKPTAPAAPAEPKPAGPAAAAAPDSEIKVGDKVTYALKYNKGAGGGTVTKIAPNGNIVIDSKGEEIVVTPGVDTISKFPFTVPAPAAAAAEPAADVIKELNSKNLTHVEGTGMGPKEADGIYISTEGGNRYATATNQARKVTVAIKNPKVSNYIENTNLQHAKLAELLKKNKITIEDIDPQYRGDIAKASGKNANQVTPNDITKWYHKVNGDTINEDYFETSARTKAAKLITEQYKKEGYDALYIRETPSEEGQLIVFDRKNVKVEPTAKAAAAEPATADDVLQKYDIKPGKTVAEIYAQENAPLSEMLAATEHAYADAYEKINDREKEIKQLQADKKNTKDKAAKQKIDQQIKDLATEIQTIGAAVEMKQIQFGKDLSDHIIARAEELGHEFSDIDNERNLQEEQLIAYAAPYLTEGRMMENVYHTETVQSFTDNLIDEHFDEQGNILDDDFEEEVEKEEGKGEGKNPSIAEADNPTYFPDKIISEEEITKQLKLKKNEGMLLAVTPSQKANGADVYVSASMDKDGPVYWVHSKGWEDGQGYDRYDGAIKAYKQHIGEEPTPGSYTGQPIPKVIDEKVAFDIPSHPVYVWVRENEYVDYRLIQQLGYKKEDKHYSSDDFDSELFYGKDENGEVDEHEYFSIEREPTYKHIKKAFGKEAADAWQTGQNAGEAVAVKEGEVFPQPENPVNLKTQKLPEIPQEQADDIVQGWKDTAAGQDKKANAKKVVISLFDYTGNWTKGYNDAGYTTIHFDIQHAETGKYKGKKVKDLDEEGEDAPYAPAHADLDKLMKQFEAGNRRAFIGMDLWAGYPQNMLDLKKRLQDAGYTVEAVLAAPPCTSFAGSGAQWWETQHDGKNGNDGLTQVMKRYGPEVLRRFNSPLEFNTFLVNVTEEWFRAFDPKTYAMENPRGRIQTEVGLPDPNLVFDPKHFGYPWTKETRLWGTFNNDLPTANVKAKGSKAHEQSSTQKVERSTTPEGFAYSFFMANNTGVAAKVTTAPAEAAPAEAPAKGGKELLAIKTEDEARIAADTGAIWDALANGEITKDQAVKLYEKAGFWVPDEFREKPVPQLIKDKDGRNPNAQGSFWTTHGNDVKSIKGPKDNVLHYIQLENGKWISTASNDYEQGFSKALKFNNKQFNTKEEAISDAAQYVADWFDGKKNNAAVIAWTKDVIKNPAGVTVEKLTFKKGERITFTGYDSGGQQALEGKYVTKPDYPGDMVAVQHGFTISLFDLATGRLLSAGETSVDDAYKAFQDSIAKKNITPQQFVNQIFSKLDNQYSSIKQLNPSPAYNRYQQAKKSAEEAAPYLYSEEERVKMDTLIKEAESKGAVRTAEYFKNQRDRKDFGKVSKAEPVNMTSARQRIDFEVQKNEEEAAKKAGVPFKNIEQQPMTKEAFEEIYIPSQIKTLKKNPELYDDLYHAFILERGLYNQYGYWPESKLSPEAKELFGLAISIIGGQNATSDERKEALPQDIQRFRELLKKVSNDPQFKVQQAAAAAHDQAAAIEGAEEQIQPLTDQIEGAEAKGEDAENSGDKVAAAEVEAEADAIIQQVDEALQEQEAAINKRTDAQLARDLGEKEVDGRTVKRQEPVQAVMGKAVPILFSKEDKEPGHYAVISADNLQPSHKSGIKNELHFIPEAQPRDRGGMAVLKNEAKKKADDLQPDQLGENNVAYYGAPVVNERGEVIQGNGRAEAVDYYYRNDKTDSKGYRDMILAKAAELGLDVDEVAKMKNPVLVKMTSADDERAIFLGNRVASELEDAKQKDADVRAAMNSLSPDKIAGLLSIVNAKTDENSTLKSIIRDNAKSIIDKLMSLGALREDNREQYFSAEGVTPEGIQQAYNFIRQLLLGGNLQAKFDELPFMQREAIEKTIPAIISNPVLRSKVQEAIGLLYEQQQSGITDFDTWQKSRDMFSPEQTAPMERYDHNVLKLAQEISKGKTQKDISTTLVQLATKMNGSPGDLFNPEGVRKQSFVQAMGGKEVTEPKPKAEEEAPPKAEEAPAEETDVPNKNIKKAADFKLLTPEEVMVLEIYRGYKPFARKENIAAGLGGKFSKAAAARGEKIIGNLKSYGFITSQNALSGEGLQAVKMAKDYYHFGSFNSFVAKEWLNDIKPPKQEPAAKPPIAAEQQQQLLDNQVSQIMEGKRNADEAMIEMDEAGIEITPEIEKIMRDAEKAYVKEKTGLQVDDIVRVRGKNGNPDFDASFRGVGVDGNYVVYSPKLGSFVINPNEIITGKNPPEPEVKTIRAEKTTYEYKDTDSHGNHLYISKDGLNAKYPYAVVTPNGARNMLVDLASDWTEFPEFAKHDLGKPPAQKPAPAPPAPKVERVIKDAKDQEKLNALFNKLRKGGGGLSIGGLDNERLEAAGEIVAFYIKKGVLKFADIIKDAYAQFGEEVRELFDYMKTAYGSYRDTDQATDEEAEQMDTGLRSFTYDNLTNKYRQNVPDQPGSGKRDSQNAPNQQPANAGNVPGNRAAGEPDRKQVEGAAAEEGRIPGGESPGGVYAPIIGESPDNELHKPITGPQSPGDDAGVVDGRGNSVSGAAGVQPDGSGNIKIDPAVKTANGSFSERERAAAAKQKLAEEKNIPHKPLNRENITETLPYLFPEQQDDVYKAENRFFGTKNPGKGMLFTNGTGTGKTFSGLGIIKRFQQQGKTNILIVVPTQEKVSDWSRDGRKLQLNIVKLKGINDGGQGMNVTTYANFRKNPELLKRDFDLVVYDESHRIMEDKDGNPSSTTGYHYEISNKNESEAFSRITSQHPVWKEASQRYAERNKVLADMRKLDDKNSPEYKELLAQSEQLAKEIERLDVIKNSLAPAIRERARKAAENTKAVFLSATPFKAHKNLRYANGYLFDWGSEEITNAQGSRVDAESRFFLEHFGSQYEWKYHQLQTKSNVLPDAVAMQEVQFANKMKADGVASGRVIDSEHDYSREFPLVTGFNSTQFNQAVNSIYNYDKNEFSELRAATQEVFHNYNYTTQLFESLKTSMSIPRIKQHLALGRQVVLFHRRQQANVSPPFESILTKSLTNAEAKKAYAIQAAALAKRPDLLAKAVEDYNTAIGQIETFRERHADLLAYEQTLNYSSAVEQIKAAFPDETVYFSGQVEGGQKKKSKAVSDFNDDQSKAKIIMVQEEAGKEGISLHDTTGVSQRVLMSLSMPISTITALQIEGRIYRIGQASNAIFEYPLLGLDLETAYFGQNINKRLGTTENLAVGDEARDLIRSFAEGVLFSSHTDPPNAEQGTGGKEFDKKASSAELTPYKKARLVYATNQKIRGRRDQRVGVDYFATPEPVGQKMVEWANLKAMEQGLEPSAGHGAIAMWFPTDVGLTAVEPSFDLYAKLGARAGGASKKVLNERFEDFNIINKFHGVVMNPPFGASGKTAMDHVEKAFKHLQDGGRIVALLPAGGAMAKRLDEFFNRSEKEGIHLRQIIKLPESTFAQAGTSVRTNVYIIDKVMRPTDENSDELMRPPRTTDLTYAEDINELFDELEDIEVPPRVPIEKKAPAAPSKLSALTESRSAVIPSTNAQVGPAEVHTHTKTGEVMHISKPTKQLGDDWERVKKLAEANDGRYNRFLKAFAFKTKEATEKFIDQANNGSSAPQFSVRSDVNPFRSNDNTPATQQSIQAKYPDAIVVQSITDLPEIVQQQAMQQGLTEVEGVLYDGDVYMVADNISDMGRAEGVYRHEKIGHAGVIKVLKNRLGGFVASLVDKASGQQLKSLNSMAQDMYGMDADQLEEHQKNILGQEYIARVAENPTKYPSTWEKIKGFVRGVLRRMGVNLAVSDNDIQVLLKRAETATGKVANKNALFSGSHLKDLLGQIRQQQQGPNAPVQLDSEMKQYADDLYDWVKKQNPDATYEDIVKELEVTDATEQMQVYNYIAQKVKAEGGLPPQQPIPPPPQQEPPPQQQPPPKQEPTGRVKMSDADSTAIYEILRKKITAAEFPSFFYNNTLAQQQAAETQSAGQKRKTIDGAYLKAHLDDLRAVSLHVAKQLEEALGPGWQEKTIRFLELNEAGSIEQVVGILNVLSTQLDDRIKAAPNGKMVYQLKDLQDRVDKLALSRARGASLALNQRRNYEDFGRGKSIDDILSDFLFTDEQKQTKDDVEEVLDSQFTDDELNTEDDEPAAETPPPAEEKPPPTQEEAAQTREDIIAMGKAAGAGDEKSLADKLKQARDAINGFEC